MSAWRFSALAVFDSLELFAVPRRYKKDVVAGVIDLGVQGKTVSRSSPEAWLAVSAWARVHSLFLILISPVIFKLKTRWKTMILCKNE